MTEKSSAASTLWLSLLLLGMSGNCFSAENGAGLFSPMLNGNKAPGVAPVADPYYLKECGSCHFPYQPGLLPARSWKKLMSALDNHFGENAELPVEDTRTLTDYLVRNAADHARYRRSQKIMKSLRPEETPLRISETPYFIAKHRELPRRMVQDNPKVETVSRCEACHTRAATGYFSEREIRIPGFGKREPQAGIHDR